MIKSYIRSFIARGYERVAIIALRNRCEIREISSREIICPGNPTYLLHFAKEHDRRDKRDKKITSQKAHETEFRLISADLRCSSMSVRQIQRLKQSTMQNLIALTAIERIKV